MSMNYLGLNYFPQSVNFYEEDAVALTEAKYGIKANGVISKLMCKIFKEGYYTEWGEEQAMLFTRKLGGEVSVQEMEGIIEILLKKGFFYKEYYEKFHVLTSMEIQRVWKEATSRRKKNDSVLPYLLIADKKMKEKEDIAGKDKILLNTENADNPTKIADYPTENADISQQSIEKHSKEKVKESIAGKEEDSQALPFLKIPGYAYNRQTHNYEGLMDNLKRRNITNPQDIAAIMKLSDYGRKNTQIWKTFVNTNWTKINAPGKYIISELVKEKRQT